MFLKGHGAQYCLYASCWRQAEIYFVNWGSKADFANRSRHKHKALAVMPLVPDVDH